MAASLRTPRVLMPTVKISSTSAALEVEVKPFARVFPPMSMKSEEMSDGSVLTLAALVLLLVAGLPMANALLGDAEEELERALGFFGEGRFEAVDGVAVMSFSLASRLTETRAEASAWVIDGMSAAWNLWRER